MVCIKENNVKELVIRMGVEDNFILRPGNTIIISIIETSVILGVVSNARFMG